MLLQDLARKKIEKEIRLHTRDRKHAIQKEIVQALNKCDACPLNILSNNVEDQQVDLNIAVQIESTCGLCKNYQKMRKLGDYLGDKSTSADYLLAKGSEISNDEILYLLELNITKKEIRLAMGIETNKQFNDYLQNNFGTITTSGRSFLYKAN